MEYCKHIGEKMPPRYPKEAQWAKNGAYTWLFEPSIRPVFITSVKEVMFLLRLVCVCVCLCVCVINITQKVTDQFLRKF